MGGDRMYRLLIAEPDEPFISAATAALSGDFEIRICKDGETALELLLDFQPHVLVLNLSLPFKDGLTVLQESGYLPPVILAITTYLSPYIEQTCAAVGVGYLLLSPTVNALRVRIIDMFNRWKSNRTPADLQKQTALHLHILNFQTHRAGYRLLCQTIPLYYKNREQCLKTDLYPTVSKLCNASSPDAVERATRKLIEYAWDHRDPVIWAKYFPNCTDCPSNKVFFDILANMLEE
ncbi:MAG: hypothetical protein IJO04_00030 [Oscillospiraceae bacterium]|nr:hypothetical protein [Oscillospiraceae bacterium]